MRLMWTPRAASDLEAIRDYIAKDSKLYAVRFTGQLVRSLKVLRKFPEFGQVVPEVTGHQVRERIFQNYRILYEIRKGRIWILAIIHASRDLSSFKPEP
jgi:toxin ParE1/3/4